MGYIIRNLPFIAIALVALCLNIIEAILILKKRKNWKPFDRLLLSLSFADMLVCVVTLIFSFKPVAGVVFIHLLVCSGNFSVLHIIIITIDRFMAIKMPLQHNIRMKGKLPYVLIGAIWAINIILVTIFGTISLVAKEAALPLIKAFAVLVLILGFCYGAAYKHMFNLVLIQAVKVRNKKDKEDNKKCCIKMILLNSNCRRERTMLITCILVVVSYIFCMYPVCIEVLIRKSMAEISMETQLLLLTNSIANPLVYFYKGLRDRRATESRTKITHGSSKKSDTDTKESQLQ